MNYARPRTRGELVNLLREGISCEVVTSSVEMTVIMLKGWLNFTDFITRPSENKGWTVFECRGVFE